MKRTPMKRRKCRLKSGGTPLKRTTPLKAKGKERFKKLRDEGLRAFVRAQGCVVASFSVHPTPCGYYPPDRPSDEACHLAPKSRGKGDRNNLFCACPRHHDEQEGRTGAFQLRYGVNLTKYAGRFTRCYEAGL